MAVLPHAKNLNWVTVIDGWIYAGTSASYSDHHRHHTPILAVYRWRTPSVATRAHRATVPCPENLKCLVFNFYLKFLSIIKIEIT